MKISSSFIVTVPTFFDLIIIFSFMFLLALLLCCVYFLYFFPFFSLFQVSLRSFPFHRFITVGRSVMALLMFLFTLSRYINP